MADNLKQSLSALVDGEASEIEVHRLLREFESDDSLRPTLLRYFHVRAVARGEHVLSTGQHIELHRRISASIEDEETFAHAPGVPRSPVVARYARPAAGLAVAAALVAAVFVGVTPDGPGTLAPVTTASNAPAVQAQPVVNVPLNPAANALANAPGNAGVLAQGSGPESLELKELTEEQQRELRAYLNRHDRMARMDPNSRTVIFDQPKEN